MAKSNGRRSKLDRSEPVVTAISVKGFKSLEKEQRLEIRPLTILAGANSSGKSSIIQPLLLMKQTLESTFDPGPLLLEGPNVRFTSADQLFWGNGTKRRAVSFTIRIEFADGTSLGLTFRTVKEKLTVYEAILENPRETRRILRIGQSTEERRRAFEDGFPERLKPVVVRDRCFLVPSYRVPGGRELRPWISRFWLLNSAVRMFTLKLIHVPGLRGNPERFYRTTAVGNAFPGTFETYAASVINHWKSQDPSKLILLGRDMERLGLTWKVDSREVEDTRVEIRVGRLPNSKQGGTHDLISIADVGFGVSQTLPVVVALLEAKKGDAVYLEEPEIHLHPRAQERMAEVLADAARRGVFVLAETHSSLLLRGVQTLVARGELAPDLVKLHWFKRSPTTGATEVVACDLDDDGAFGDWPEDFDEVSLQTEKAYLDAVERKSLR